MQMNRFFKVLRTCDMTVQKTSCCIFQVLLIRVCLLEAPVITPFAQIFLIVHA